MKIEEIRTLPVQEKMQIMEAIWDDFRERVEKSDISEEHKRLLDERRDRVREGKAKLVAWADVKGTR